MRTSLLQSLRVNLMHQYVRLVLHISIEPLSTHKLIIALFHENMQKEINE